MRDALHVAVRELRVGFRNPWAYSFTALFAIFSLSLLLIQSEQGAGGYSGTTSSMLNLILYLLPLMTLLLGSFSLTTEKEEGSWRLLSTYPLRTSSFVVGKYAGLACVLLAIVAFGFGLSGLAGSLFGNSFETRSYMMFLSFSAGLVLLFLSLSLVIGTLAGSRWQALTWGVSIWFFLVIGWPTLLVAFLGKLPYLWIKPVLVTLTMLNPAELVRLFIVVKLGGGSVLGPEYYKWVLWIDKPTGVLIFLMICLIWLACSGLFALMMWERGRTRG